MTASVETEDNIDRALAKLPMLSRLANDPIDPMENADPTEPIEANELTDPIEANEFRDPRLQDDPFVDSMGGILIRPSSHDALAAASSLSFHRSGCAANVPVVSASS